MNVVIPNATSAYLADELPSLVPTDTPLTLVPGKQYTSIARLTQWPMMTLMEDRVSYSFSTWRAVRRVYFKVNADDTRLRLVQNDTETLAWVVNKGRVCIHVQNADCSFQLQVLGCTRFDTLSAFEGIVVDVLSIE